MIGAFVKAPPFAWSGWRLRNPGGPEGGQYHGFIGPDSLGWRGLPGNPPPAAPPSPWDSVWGGTALAEGENRSDYVYRSSAEIRPRPNASGGTNVVSAFQTQRSAGYAEAPGNYKGVGALPIVHYCPGGSGSGGSDCGPGGIIYDVFGRVVSPGPGATNVVTQPPPPAVQPQYVTGWTLPPVSPSPSPTVSSTPTAASAAAAAAATNPIGAWLTASSIIPGVENMYLAAGAIAAYLLLRGRR
jgi:hypothetical protein